MMFMQRRKASPSGHLDDDRARLHAGDQARDASRSRPSTAIRQNEHGEESESRRHLKVNFPKLARLELMLEYSLEEERQIPLDEGLRRKLRDVADQALVEVGDAVPGYLKDELSRLVEPLDRQDRPSKDELRVVQAQLKGWLLGLMMSVQVTPRPAPE